MLQTFVVRAEADYLAPDGSEIRFLPRMSGGGLQPLKPPDGQDLIACAPPPSSRDLVCREPIGRGLAQERCRRRKGPRGSGDKPADSASHRVPVLQHGQQLPVPSHRDDATVAGYRGG